MKLSFRGRPGTDVRAVAATFGGGGHVLAAGAMTDGPPDAVVGRVVDAFRRAFAG